MREVARVTALIVATGETFGRRRFPLTRQGDKSWPGYATGLPFVLRRYCGLWGRGT